MIINSERLNLRLTINVTANTHIGVAIIGNLFFSGEYSNDKI